VPGLSEGAAMIGFKGGLSTTIRHVRHITRRREGGGYHDGDTGRRSGHIQNGQGDPSPSLLEDPTARKSDRKKGEVDDYHLHPPSTDGT